MIVRRGTVGGRRRIDGGKNESGGAGPRGALFRGLRLAAALGLALILVATHGR